MEEAVSFSSQVKREIASLSFSALQKRAILSAFIKCNGFLRLSSGEWTLDLSTDHNQVAEFLFQAISDCYRIPCRFSCVSSFGSGRSMRFHVLASHPETILSDLEIEDFSSKLPPSFTTREETISAYLAGAFLACGYVNDPRSSNYHLEFSFNDEVFANRFCRLVSRAHSSNFPSKVSSRRKQTIVYMKKSDKISELLVYMGASESCLNFESIRVDRDFANIGNRLKNLDKANDAKRVSAAARQIKEIQCLSEKGLLEGINNPKIALLCELRLSSPDASMEELADLLSDTMGMTISKSNINHLFRAIHSLYLEAMGEGGDGQNDEA